MRLYQPKALQKLLEELKTYPRKSLAQNFLIDGNIVRKIINASNVQAGDQVLEVGPGPGVLTEALLEKGASVTAIEKDTCFFEALQAWNHPALTLIHQDFLHTDLLSILKGATKVVANIPYNITGILLQKLLPMGKLISSLTLMVQKEVAERIIAKKGTSNYSSFTLFTSYYSKPKLLFTVEPTCFYPKPKVTSAVIQFILKKINENTPSPLGLIRNAFHHRRKMLRVSLKPFYSTNKIAFALNEMGLPASARPQELSLDEFWQLNRLLLQ